MTVESFNSYPCSDPGGLKRPFCGEGVEKLTWVFGEGGAVTGSGNREFAVAIGVEVRLCMRTM